MYSTQQVVRALRRANPEATVTEDRVRNVLRRGELTPPGVFAGRFAWTLGEVHQLARHLDLVSPTPEVLSDSARVRSAAVSL